MLGLETAQRAGHLKLYLGGNGSLALGVWPFIGIFCSNWVIRAPGKFHEPWEGNLWDPRFKSRKVRSTHIWGCTWHLVRGGVLLANPDQWDPALSPGRAV